MEARRVSTGAGALPGSRTGEPVLKPAASSAGQTAAWSPAQPRLSSWGFSESPPPGGFPAGITGPLGGAGAGPAEPSALVHFWLVRLEGQWLAWVGTAAGGVGRLGSMNAALPSSRFGSVGSSLLGGGAGGGESANDSGADMAVRLGKRGLRCAPPLFYSLDGGL